MRRKLAILATTHVCRASPTETSTASVVAFATALNLSAENEPEFKITEAKVTQRPRPSASHSPFLTPCSWEYYTQNRSQCPPLLVVVALSSNIFGDISLETKPYNERILGRMTRAQYEENVIGPSAHIVGTKKAEEENKRSERQKNRDHTCVKEPCGQQWLPCKLQRQ